MIKYILLSIVLFLSGCASSYYPEATGGSKSDAIITVTYGYPNRVNPNDWTKEWQGIDASATKRCKNWGYSSAVRFDRAEKWCITWNGFGDCTYWKESLNYQCVDF